MLGLSKLRSAVNCHTRASKALFMALAALSACSPETPQKPLEALTGCLLTQSPKEDSKKPTILIIGDSISIGYTPHIRAKLPQINVIHNECNAQRSRTGVSYVKKWLSQSLRHDIVTFNHGVWDLQEANISVAEYKANLKYIATQIKLKSLRPTFITTTYLPTMDQNKFYAFKEASLQAMAELQINVIDLEAYSRTILQHQNLDSTHFYGTGDELLADYIAAELQKLYNVNSIQ